jgi:hypothetical protein
MGNLGWADKYDLAAKSVGVRTAEIANAPHIPERPRWEAKPLMDVVGVQRELNGGVTDAPSLPVDENGRARWDRNSQCGHVERSATDVDQIRGAVELHRTARQVDEQSVERVDHDDIPAARTAHMLPHGVDHEPSERRWHADPHGSQCFLRDLATV